MFKVSILTVSDRASTGEYADKSGPALQEWAIAAGYEVAQTKVVPDSIKLIQEAIVEFCKFSDLILTTGGTGFGVRDYTPEAIKPLLDKEANGLTIAMMASSLQITPLASLSRPICGVRGNTLIITLPGSAKGALENIQSIQKVLGHALELCGGERNAGEAFHHSLHSSRVHSCKHHENASTPQADGKLSNDPSKNVTARSRVSPFPMISYEDAINLVLNETNVEKKVIEKSIKSSLFGYVLAEDVFAAKPVPDYRASIVDGYAVNDKDGPGVYPVVSGASTAGKNELVKLEPGTIMRITTGALVPTGATAVVMVEDTELIETSADGKEEKLVRIISKVDSTNIRDIGSDIKPGELLLSKGQQISFIGGEVGTLASVGITTIKVYDKPIVAILSTGNEVYEADYSGTIPLGGIRDANRPLLKSAIEACGYTVEDLGIAPDDVDQLKNIILNGLSKADVLVTTGGVSMGELDLLKPVLERELNATIHFGRVKLKPGKPTTFATVMVQGRKKFIFALPGNPVSALVTFYLFVQPCLKRLCGLTDVLPMLFKTKITHEIKLDPRPEYYRVVLKTVNGQWEATGTGFQISSRITSFVSANGLLKLPPRSKDQETIPAGSFVDAFFL